MPNIEYLEGTMQHIVDHPENHDQQTWVDITDCGTTACFAGWTCLLYGGEWQSLPCEPALFFNRRTGWRMSARVLATELLHLYGPDADLLFHPANTIDDLQQIVKDLINGQHASYDDSLLAWLNEQ